MPTVSIVMLPSDIAKFDGADSWLAEDKGQHSHLMESNGRGGEGMKQNAA